jgi:hypothetical protein
MLEAPCSHRLSWSFDGKQLAVIRVQRESDVVLGDSEK